MFNKALRMLAMLSTFSGILAASNAQQTVIARQVPPIVQSGRAQYVASTNRSETLELALILPLVHQDQLDSLLTDLYNPASPNFHKWITPEEFKSHFAPPRQEFDQMVSWARANGFTVTSQAADGRLITVNASVDAVNRAFHIIESNFHDTQLNRIFHAPDREPTTDLPFALLEIEGLDNSQPKFSQLKRDPKYGLPNTLSAPATNHRVLGLDNITGGLATSGEAILTPGQPLAIDRIEPRLYGSGPNGSYLPSDMRAAYYGSGNLTGAGQTVGIFSFDGYLTSDLTLYYAKTGMSTTVPVNNVLVGGYSGGCFSTSNGTTGTCDDGEQILDIVQVQGMAPGLTQILFYEGTSANGVLSQMVTDNTAKVISSSWGGGGFGTASDTYFRQMATQGQSFLNATGDNGGLYKSNYSAPSFDPYITQVGGTDLNTPSAGGPWASEVSWSNSGGGYWLTGMSTSAQYTIPAWQSQAGVITAANAGSTLYRNVPDIAAEANFDNPTVSNGSFLLGYGGTSYAAPRMAGYIALANQQATANGSTNTGVGFINPALYAAGLSSSAATVYHDITVGSNPGTTSSGAQTGPTYNAVAGYDLVTGWGSPNGTGLLNALAGAPVADFSIPPTASSTMVRGGSCGVSIPITGYNGWNGNVLPTGISGLPSGWGASYTSGTGTTSTPLQLYFSSPSTNVIGTYSIVLTLTDSNNSALTHNITISVAVYKRANGDFTMTTSGATVPQGKTDFAYINVAIGTGLAGPVQLSVSGAPQGVTASFFDPTVGPNVSKNVPLTIAVSPSATVGTYTLVVTGYNASGLTHTVNVPLTVTAPPSLLTNGGFETGSALPWTNATTCGTNPGLYNVSSGFPPHSGNNFLLMAGTSAACTQTLSQQVTIPSNASRTVLSFWYRVLTNQTSKTTVYDTLTVQVTDTSGNVLATLGPLSNLNGGGYWAYTGLDISQFKGRTVIIKLTAAQASSTATDFLVDDIAVSTY